MYNFYIKIYNEIQVLMLQTCRVGKMNLVESVKVRWRIIAEETKLVRCIHSLMASMLAKLKCKVGWHIGLACSLNPYIMKAFKSC